MKKSDRKSCERHSGGKFKRFYVYFNIVLFIFSIRIGEIRNESGRPCSSLHVRIFSFFPPQ